MWNVNLSSRKERKGGESKLSGFWDAVWDLILCFGWFLLGVAVGLAYEDWKRRRKVAVSG